jgi:ABC-type glycerol-3-phosphate transport system substrate-binding protein
LIARPAIAQRAAACLLLLLLLTACAITAAQVPQNPTEPAGAAKNSVTLVLWHGWSSAARQTLSRLVDQFNRRHPDGQIVLQPVPLATFDGDLRGALAAGSGPQTAAPFRDPIPASPAVQLARQFRAGTLAIFLQRGCQFGTPPS